MSKKKNTKPKKKNIKSNKKTATKNHLNLTKKWTLLRRLRLLVEKRFPKKISSRKIFKIISLSIILVAIGPLIYLLNQLPSPAKLNQPGAFPTSSQIFDRNHQLLYQVYSDYNRQPIPLDSLPEYVSEAHLAIEDQNFYHHFGLDPQGIIRAIIANLKDERLEGGSTITQQLVKITLLTPERTLTRKIKEALLSVLTEIRYTKKQILEMYLNHAPYGGIAYGIESATQIYFNKSAKDLTLAEAALLAGLPQAPTRYSPFGSQPEQAFDRQKQVLDRMLKEKFISLEEKNQALDQTLEFASPSTTINAPHFSLWVRDRLIDELGEDLVKQGGLKITTTLDLGIQNQSQIIVTEEVERLEKRGYRLHNGAALITNPQTGEILAMIGSRDYFNDEYDGKVNLTIRPRQPGSSIKPLIYATAFAQKKLTAGSLLLDIPTCWETPFQPLYCPRNYDGGFSGAIYVRQALGNSRNIPAVKTAALIGVENIVTAASTYGITTWKDPSNYGISLGLGGGEITMIDQAVAFGALANYGLKTPLNPIIKIENSNGEILYQAPENPPSEPVLPPAVAYIISHILQDNSARSNAFGPNSQLRIKDQIVSVKTGTTNDLKDNWTIGYTPNLLITVWVGNNDNQPMSYLASGVTGAAPIWHDLMTNLLQDQPAVWPDQPDDVVQRTVCNSHTEYFWDQALPDETSCPITKGIWIKKDTNLPLEPNIPLEEQGEVELQEHRLASDPFTQDFCLDCAWPAVTDPETNTIESISYPQFIVKYQPTVLELP
jgi:penicillin-binding protein 1C